MRFVMCGLPVVNLVGAQCIVGRSNNNNLATGTKGCTFACFSNQSCKFVFSEILLTARFHWPKILYELVTLFWHFFDTFNKEIEPSMVLLMGESGQVAMVYCEKPRQSILMLSSKWPASIKTTIFVPKVVELWLYWNIPGVLNIAVEFPQRSPLKIGDSKSGTDFKWNSPLGNINATKHAYNRVPL